MIGTLARSLPRSIPGGMVSGCTVGTTIGGLGGREPMCSMCKRDTTPAKHGIFLIHTGAGGCSIYL